MKNIPKKIHLIWFGPKEPNIPYLEKIKKIYNDYEVKIWREEDFDLQNINEFTKIAFNQKKWAFVSDYFRMKILFEEGGIYLDADMEPVEKFAFDSDADLFMGYEYRNNVTMGFIASAPKHKFVKSVMEYYESIINPNFFPLGNLVWTEILYSNYPRLGISNKDKRCEDLQIMGRSSFGLWNKTKRKSYFIHRHSIDWINSRFLKSMIHTSAKFAKLTPAFAENIMVLHQRRMTNKKSIMTLDKGSKTFITISSDIGMVTKELFERITSEKKYISIHLEFKNKKLSKTLSKIYNVKSVTYGKRKTSYRYKDKQVVLVKNINSDYGQKIRIKYKKIFLRSNIETMTNIYSRLFKSGVDELILK